LIKSRFGRHVTVADFLCAGVAARISEETLDAVDELIRLIQTVAFGIPASSSCHSAARSPTTA
jgi:hypothetical protein